MLRCATNAGFVALLEKQCGERAHLFDPEAEKRLVLNLVLSALSAAPPRKPFP